MTKLIHVYAPMLGVLLALGSASSLAALQPGVFNVSDYSASNSHTDYDMAREAADAYAAQYSWSSGSVLILKLGLKQQLPA